VNFIVVDELHTYRGRLGADMALLMRRVRERCRNPSLRFIGTSATMASGGTRQERRSVVAGFAQQLFDVEVELGDVVEETLERLIPHDTPRDEDSLRRALQDPLPWERWEEFVSNPVSAWIEDTFGIKEEEGFSRRQLPRTLRWGAERLAEQIAGDVGSCENRLKEMFLLGTRVRKPENRNAERAFAFKLHQFVSQADSVYATLESSSQRFLTLRGQRFAPGRENAFLYPLCFCRECGQEYYRATMDETAGQLLPGTAETSWSVHDIDDETTNAQQQTRTPGYFMPDSDGIWGGNVEDLPEDWFDSKGKLKKDYRSEVPRRFWVRRDGMFDEDLLPDAQSGWFLRSPLLLCLRCGETYTRRDGEFRKLSSLASSGRSSATTFLTMFSVAAMRDAQMDARGRKVLSFTDNRQDASLQAGHFRDFVQVALIRSALLNALENRRSLRFEEIANQVVETLRPELREFAMDPTWDPTTPQAKRARDAFLNVIEYRLYEDLRRGWRIIQPNLEQCGLIRMNYEGLDELAADGAKWRGVPLMDGSSVEERRRILWEILEEMRHQLAIAADPLDPSKQSELQRRASQYLNDLWRFDEEERLREGSLFVVSGHARADRGDRTLSRRSAIGRFLLREARRHLGVPLEEDEYGLLMTQLLENLRRAGFIRPVSEGKGKYQTEGFRLQASALVWTIGDGTPVVHSLRRRKTTTARSADYTPFVNEFFRDFYRDALGTLRRMDAAEHTAQVNYNDRKDREERFELGDEEGGLPCLFCSPTMELGIDIKGLNAVHLRNVPPTPANYAQRSGRAGRSGQPALVFTYCGFASGHDQYFFRRQHEVVAGAVTPPRFDLANEQLLKAHLHAVWLASVRLSLTSSIVNVLDVARPEEGYPFRAEVREQLELSDDEWQARLEMGKRVVAACDVQQETAPWFSSSWVEETLRQAPVAFDRAFDRWRDLWRTAQHLIERGQALIRDAAFLPKKQKELEEEGQLSQRTGMNQRNLLLNQDTNRRDSDFYPYRYLADEGFLPGYNFPKLPVRAFVPRGDGEYLARSRFIALSEFGPQSVIYHEGGKYQVQRVFLDSQTPLTRAKLCRSCGCLHEGANVHADMCDHCHASLSGENCDFLTTLLKMPTVSARRIQRITCDEEERQRKGYELTTHFRFASVSGTSQRRTAEAFDASDAPVVRMMYGPSANLWRVNHRWQKSEERGFALDPTTGKWLSQTKMEDDPDILARAWTGIRLFVEDTANILLVSLPLDDENEHREATLATLQYALSRGIQAVFQVEESEIASERIGEGASRSILFWENAEGGLGVLQRLTNEDGALAQVARAALRILHFESDGEETPSTSAEECVQACYDCLLSYYNQRDHALLNRRLIEPLLRRLASSIVRQGGATRSYEDHYRWLRSLTDSRSELERRLLDRLFETKRRLPDDAQRAISDIPTIPDFFYETNICVYCDGSVHDDPQQRAHDNRTRSELREHGYRVLVLRYDDDLPAWIERHSEVFGAQTAGEGGR